MTNERLHLMNDTIKVGDLIVLKYFDMPNELTAIYMGYQLDKGDGFGYYALYEEGKLTYVSDKRRLRIISAFEGAKG